MGAVKPAAYDSADEETENAVISNSSTVDTIIDVDFGEDIPF